MKNLIKIFIKMQSIVDKYNEDGYYRFFMNRSNVEIIAMCLTYPEKIISTVDFFMFDHPDFDELFSILFTHPLYYNFYCNTRSLDYSINQRMPKTFKALEKILKTGTDFFKNWTTEDYDDETLKELDDIFPNQFENHLLKTLIEIDENNVYEINLLESDIKHIEIVCEGFTDVVIKFLNENIGQSFGFAMYLIQLLRLKNLYIGDINVKNLFHHYFYDFKYDEDENDLLKLMLIQINNNIYDGRNEKINNFSLGYDDPVKCFE